MYKMNHLEAREAYLAMRSALSPPAPDVLEIKDIDSIYDSNLCWVILGINSAQVEYSAYVPKFIEENTYNFKRINII